MRNASLFLLVLFFCCGQMCGVVTDPPSTNIPEDTPAPVEEKTPDEESLDEEATNEESLDEEPVEEELVVEEVPDEEPSNQEAPDEELVDEEAPTVPSTFNVEVTVLGNGAVLLDPPGGVYTAGETVTATAVPDDGWVFLGWAGDATGADPSIQISEAASLLVVFTWDAADGPSEGCGPDIESRIDGESCGFEGDTIFPLINGQIWQQSEYYYRYRYAYRPAVHIFCEHGIWRIRIEGIDRAVRVIRLK